jgi:hypothetical protein
LLDELTQSLCRLVEVLLRDLPHDGEDQHLWLADMLDADARDARCLGWHDNPPLHHWISIIIPAA